MKLHQYACNRVITAVRVVNGKVQVKYREIKPKKE